MSFRTPTPQNTKATSSATFLNDEIQRNNPATASGPDRSELNLFLEAVANAVSLGPREEALPYIEAPRVIIEYINRGKLEGFDQVGYCIFNGCKVYEVGKREEALRRDSLTTEQRNFGGAK